MPYKKIALEKVAPAEKSRSLDNHGGVSWLLTLDQIEKDTGYLSRKKTVEASKVSTSTHEFDTRHVLYSKLRPNLNKVVCPEEKGVATTELVRLVPNQSIIVREFLAYYLRSEYFMQFARQCVAGAKMPRMVMRDFWAHEVPCPPIPEQHRIVEILDQADALRRKRREAGVLSEKILPALFHKMFGDPIENLTGWPTQFGNELFCEFCYGSNAKCHEKKEAGDLPVLRISNILECEVLWDNLKYASLKLEEAEKLRIRSGDILFVRTNGNPDYIARCAVFEGDRQAAYASYLIKGRIDPQSKALPEFIQAQVSLPSYRPLIKAQTKTTAGNCNISADGLRKLEFIVPPEDLQAEFARTRNQLKKIRLACVSSRENLETLFQSLLQRAFDGRLTAKWRETHSELKEGLRELEHQAKN